MMKEVIYLVFNNLILLRYLEFVVLTDSLLNMYTKKLLLL